MIDADWNITRKNATTPFSRWQLKYAGLNKMKIETLYKVKDIRLKIQYVLGDANDRRIVATAFVGREPAKLLSAKENILKDLILYCWPKAGGTNPYGIDELLKNGVNVKFIDGLHAKIYWSEKGGVVIGSANLSDNALGAGNLLEAAVYLPSGEVDIDQILAHFKTKIVKEQDFEGRLKKLHQEHVEFYRRNPRDPLTNKDGGDANREARAFLEWFGMKNRPEWQLGLWVGNVEPPSDCVKEFEELHSTEKKPKKIGNWRGSWGDNESELQLNVPTLGCKAKMKGDLINGIDKRSSMQWWFPEIRLKSKEWPESPFVWFARECIPAGCEAPFNWNDKKFIEALNDTLSDTSPDDYKELVSDEFAEKLKQKYSDN